MTGIHTGHRQRLRETFLANGLDAMQDVNALELLLCYTVPRRDMNPTAHALMDHFGSLANIFEAPMDALMTQGGLSEYAATLIKLAPAVARRAAISRAEMDRVLDNTKKCGAYLASFFYGAREEMVYALALDAKCKALGCSKLFNGTVNTASMSVRSVVNFALRTNASSVVLAHNHPSGVAIPSQEDVRITKLVFDALDMVDVLLADHIIVADEDYVSMVESGMMPQKTETPEE